SLGSTSRALRDVAVSAADHGGAAVTAGKSVACVWSGFVVGDFAPRHERNLFARSAARGRTRLRARARARVASRTLRSHSRDAAADLVSRVLCLVHDLSVHFPSTVCWKNRPVGDSSACWSTPFLSYLSARSDCVPQPSSRPGAGRICAAGIA